MIIQEVETTQMVKDTKLYINKLKNMKLHLTELINKKFRLEIEIKSLQKTIINKQKEYERTLKVKLKVESTGIVDSKTKQRIINEDPQLHYSLLEFDELEREIYDLLDRNNLLEQTEK